MKTIVLTGGGTGGHIMPIIALLPKLKEMFDNIVYIGSFNGMEKEIISKYKDIKYYGITTVKLDRSKIFKNFAIPFKLLRGILDSKKIYKEIKPDVIFSKGGYVALPVVLASKKIPIISHESDFTLGLANRIIYRKCDVMCTSFEETTKNYQKAVYTGLPIRISNNNSCKQKFSLNDKLKTLLVFGGSLGAKSINECVFENARKLCEIVNVIHIVGKGNKPKEIKDLPFNYNILEFVDNMGEIYKCVDLAVSRAGSNAIYELLQSNIPMLLIPLENASRGEQVENAKYFENKNYALVLKQTDLRENEFLTKVKELCSKAEEIKKSQLTFTLLNGTDEIIKIIKNYL